MFNKLKKSNQGFTIIEVLIVLAIAGLILLIVFLAVPALQRNNRNTQYRVEASRILGGAQEFINNNSGNLPSSADGNTIRANANAQQITSLTVVNPGTVTAVTPTTSAATLETGAKCPTPPYTTSITPVTAGAPGRSLILIYAIEKADGTLQAQCVES